MKDFSIQITGQTVTGSMYDLDMGPKPADAVAKPLPVLFYPQPQGDWTPLLPYDRFFDGTGFHPAQEVEQPTPPPSALQPPIFDDEVPW
jgi:hypothetical protein